MEALNQDEFFTLLDEVPCGTDSDVDDMSGDELEGDDQEQNTENTSVFDIEAMDIVFADDILPAVDGQADEPIEPDENAYDSEEELTLAELRTRILRYNSPIWTCDPGNVIKNKKEFDEVSGPCIPGNLESPTDVFLHIFPMDLIEYIAFQTNLYALQTSGGNENSFQRTSAEEIKVYLALNLLMGIKPLPSMRDYWSSRRELRDTFISSCMSRDRFIWLTRNIHLNDNSLQPKANEDNFDKLYKIRPMLDKLSQTFVSSYKPSKHQAVDESMIKFKGRSSLRQYMPMKPIKRGYKVWIRADKSGYVCKFQIYTGKVLDATEKNLGARVVKDLTQDLIGHGHYLYFDNFFNSVDLQRYLQNNFIYACGTARKGRKDTPEDIKEDKDMERGQSDFRVSKDGLVYLKWKDRKGVLFISNHDDPINVATVSRRNKHGTLEEIPCPKLVKDYNANMGFVDKMDMLKSIYEVDRKSKKWWHRIFWYFLDVSLINSYILFKQRSDGNTLSLKTFRLSVALGLIGAKPDLPKKGRKQGNIEPLSNFKPTVPLEVRFDKCAHMPVHGKPRRCAHCSTRKEPHKSSWSCSTCNVGLCLNDKKNCFAPFHEK